MPVKQTRVRRIVRNINEIIVHCSDTYPEQDVGVAEIDAWHRQRGFQSIGYHYVVRRNGIIEIGRDIARAGAHCYEHNAESIGVCWVGGREAWGDSSNGRPTDNRTPEQRMSLDALLKVLHTIWPNATLHGHREFSAKACPCFDVHKDYGYIFGETEVEPK